MSSQYTFTGQFTFSIDSKNRINIPAPLRKQFSKKDKKTLVVTSGIDQCTWIYPISEWNFIQNELTHLGVYFQKLSYVRMLPHRLLFLKNKHF